MQEGTSAPQGRVGIQLETTSYAVTPGQSIAIPILLTNHGLEEDVLTLSVDGIPVSWVYVTSPSTRLVPGQAEQVSLTVQPPRSLQAGAGRHPFRIRALSQLAPGQVFEVECALTVSAFAEFSSELRPQRVQAGEPARVTVENRGNFQQAFTLTCQSPEDSLSFEPGPSQELRVPPGEVAIAEFRATPRNRPLFGGTASFPFNAHVQSAHMAVQNHSGEVESRALIPSWVLPLVLVAALVMACIAGAVFLGLLSPDDAPEAPDAPAATSTPGEGQPAPTEAPPEAPTEAPPEPPTDEPPEPLPEPLPVETTEG